MTRELLFKIFDKIIGFKEMGAIFESLSKRQREILLRIYVMGEKPSDIAMRQGVTRSSIGGIEKQAISKLKEEVTLYYFKEYVTKLL